MVEATSPVGHQNLRERRAFFSQHPADHRRILGLEGLAAGSGHSISEGVAVGILGFYVQLKRRPWNGPADLQSANPGYSVWSSRVTIKQDLERRNWRKRMGIEPTPRTATGTGQRF